MAARFLVGLTGGIGSGKSSAGRLFETHGVTVIDADAISRALTAAGGRAMAAICGRFGPEFADPAGALDRARMRSLVFSDAGAKRALESILHPMVRTVTDEQVAQSASDYAILMIPLLVESTRPRERCTRIAVVDCVESIQIERVIQRDALARDQVEAIVRAQVSRAVRLRHADDVIDNTGGPADLVPQVARLHTQYCAIARSSPH